MSDAILLAKQTEKEIVDAAWEKYKEETANTNKLGFWEAAEAHQNARAKFFGEFFRAHRVVEQILKEQSQFSIKGENTACKES